MESLFSLLREGVTAFHTIDYVKRDLLSAGFLELSLDAAWQLEENKGYYVNLYGSNAIVFRTGRISGSVPDFRIAMAHSDHPVFQIKPNPMIAGKNVARLNVEIYGGMYQKSWLDRPLGIAGRIVTAGHDAFTPVSVSYKSNRPLCIIPSLAIHMDRELNHKGALDTAKELVPVASLDGKGDLVADIAKELDVKREAVLDFDLYLYNMEQPVLLGLDRSMIAAPKLDNLTSVAAVLEGIKKAAPPSDTIDVMVVFDNEEVGSRTIQGADTDLLPMVIERIGTALRPGGFEKSAVMNRGFLLSVDVAHAYHPNYEEKSDVTNRAFLGKGICIKRSVGQKYGTTADTAAVVKAICEKEDLPYTIAVNKTGISGGSTLGPIVASHLPMPCADIGMPILAMHSATELGAAADYLTLKAFLRAFYDYVR